MSSMSDDFLNSLSYQVKEEVINNYLHERLILEQEIEEYREAVEKYRTIEAEVRKTRDDLAGLLVTSENFQKFFQRLGFTPPPLARLGSANAEGRPPACPAGLSLKGFTHKGRYLKLIFEAYALLHQKAEEAGQAADEVLALAGEINEDIKNFHNNHDIVTIINFLKSMDIDLVTKKIFLAGSFEADKVNALEKSMTFKPLNPPADGVRTWPRLPSPEKARKLTADLVAEIFHQEKENIMPALNQ